MSYDVCLDYFKDFDTLKRPSLIFDRKNTDNEENKRYVSSSQWLCCANFQKRSHFQWFFWVSSTCDDYVLYFVLCTLNQSKQIFIYNFKNDLLLINLLLNFWPMLHENIHGKIRLFFKSQNERAKISQLFRYRRN